jgi:hypothetical protein
VPSEPVPAPDSWSTTGREKGCRTTVSERCAGREDREAAGEASASPKSDARAPVNTCIRSAIRPVRPAGPADGREKESLRNPSMGDERTIAWEIAQVQAGVGDAGGDGLCHVGHVDGDGLGPGGWRVMERRPGACQKVDMDSLARAARYWLRVEKCRAVRDQLMGVVLMRRGRDDVAKQ